jgi:hypothetical protein
MKWQSRDKLSQKSASQRVCGQLARQERGANRGRAGVEDCACDRSNSEQGMGAERGACGFPRERTVDGLHSSAVAGSGGSDEGRSWRRSQ